MTDPSLFAVGALKSGVTVGHVPRNISSICSLFLRHGGAIRCTVTGSRHYSVDLEQGGLEIPCTLKFEVDSEKLSFLLDKTQKLVSSPLFKGKAQPPRFTHEVSHHKEKSETDEVPETKKMKLSECDLTDCQSGIMKGEMLSDIPINIAQRLLKKQFSNLKGLQPTVYQQRNQAAESVCLMPVENQLQ